MMNSMSLLWVGAWDRWFYSLLRIRLFDLPVLVIPLSVISLFIPVIAWWLQRRNWIAAATHRRIEMLWLIALTILAFSTWGIWSIDFCFRTVADHTTPLVFGYMVGIVLLSLWRYALRQWRAGMCLAGHSLFKSLLFAALHFALFWSCLCVVVFVGFGIFRGDIFLPDGIVRVFLIISILLHLAVSWFARTLFLRWRGSASCLAAEQTASKPAPVYRKTKLVMGRLRTWLVVVAIAILAVVAVTWLLDAPWLPRNLRPSALREAQSRRQRIRQEAESLCGCEWAGEYYLGDGLGGKLHPFPCPAIRIRLGGDRTPGTGKLERQC